MVVRNDLINMYADLRVVPMSKRSPRKPHRKTVNDASGVGGTDSGGGSGGSGGAAGENSAADGSGVSQQSDAAAAAAVITPDLDTNTSHDKKSPVRRAGARAAAAIKGQQKAAAKPVPPSTAAPTPPAKAPVRHASTVGKYARSATSAAAAAPPALKLVQNAKGNSVAAAAAGKSKGKDDKKTNNRSKNWRPWTYVSTCSRVIHRSLSAFLVPPCLLIVVRSECGVELIDLFDTHRPVAEDEFVKVRDELNMYGRVYHVDEHADRDITGIQKKWKEVTSQDPPTGTWQCCSQYRTQLTCRVALVRCFVYARGSRACETDCSGNARKARAGG